MSTKVLDKIMVIIKENLLRNNGERLLKLQQHLEDDTDGTNPLDILSPQDNFHTRGNYFSTIKLIAEALKNCFTEDERKLLGEEEKRKQAGFAVDIPMYITMNAKDELIVIHQKEEMHIPAERCLCIPSKRKPDMRSILCKGFGTPIEAELKSRGLIPKGKRSKVEMHNELNKRIFKKIVPALDMLVGMGKISQKEGDDIQYVIQMIQVLYARYCKENREVVNKDIMTAKENIDKMAFTDQGLADNLKKDLFKNEEGSCRVCGKIFIKKKTTQYYCSEHSNSADYQHERRRKRGLKPRGGARPGSGRPKKSTP